MERKIGEYCEEADRRRHSSEQIWDHLTDIVLNAYEIYHPQGNLPELEEDLDADPEDMADLLDDDEDGSGISASEGKVEGEDRVVGTEVIGDALDSGYSTAQDGGDSTRDVDFSDLTGGTDDVGESMFDRSDVH